MKDVDHRKINLNAKKIESIEISQVFLMKLCIDLTARSMPL